MFDKLIKIMKSCRRVKFWSWGGLVSLYHIWGFGEVRSMSRGVCIYVVSGVYVTVSLDYWALGQHLEQHLLTRNFLTCKFCTMFGKLWVIFFWKKKVGHKSIFGAADTPVSDFWWRVLWVSKSSLHQDITAKAQNLEKCLHLQEEKNILY